MSDITFVQGVKITEKETQYGVITKISINKEKFLENPFNNGWLNFDIKHGKDSGKPYAQLDTYYQTRQAAAEDLGF